MTALAADKDVQEKQSPWGMEHAPAPAASSTQFYKGGLLVLDQADGLVKKAATGTTFIAIGRCEENVLTGASNARRLRCRSGIFPFVNSSAADLIAADDIGKPCYIVDDQTVALTSNSSARSLAGTVYEVDTDGTVWVAIKFPLI